MTCKSYLSCYVCFYSYDEEKYATAQWTEWKSIDILYHGMFCLSQALNLYESQRKFLFMSGLVRWFLKKYING